MISLRKILLHVVERMEMLLSILLVGLILLLNEPKEIHAFLIVCPPQLAFKAATSHRPFAREIRRRAENEKESSTTVEEYRNAATQFLSNFMTTSKEEGKISTVAGEIDDDDAFWSQSKLKNVPIDVLAQALDAELCRSQWFVTGRVNPIYFSDSFRFQDPDVKVNGIRDYARGVQKIFDPSTARADILSTQINLERGENVITCTWRLSGKVNIGPGINIKPYIVYTDFTVDPSDGLIVFQEDRFDLPSWDILLSALIPFVIGIITAPPAPVPPPRDPMPQMPNISRYRK
jgi:hypothetical protein